MVRGDGRRRCGEGWAAAWDVITKVAGTDVTSVQQLSTVLAGFTVGKAVPVVVQRGGSPHGAGDRPAVQRRIAHAALRTPSMPRPIGSWREARHSLPRNRTARSDRSGRVRTRRRQRPAPAGRWRPRAGSGCPGDGRRRSPGAVLLGLAANATLGCWGWADPLAGFVPSVTVGRSGDANQAWSARCAGVHRGDAGAVARTATRRHAGLGAVSGRRAADCGGRHFRDRHALVGSRVGGHT